MTGALNRSEVVLFVVPAGITLGKGTLWLRGSSVGAAGVDSGLEGPFGTAADGHAQE